MLDYPPPYAATIRDGRAVMIRPMDAEDAMRLAAFHDKLEPQSVFLRYFAFHPRLSTSELVHLTDVDGFHRMALIATDEAGDIVGVGRYMTGPDGGPIAEIAFILAEDWQGQGLCRALARGLRAAAGHYGVTRFTAEVLPRNTRMLKAFRSFGLPVTMKYEDGVIAVDMPLPEAPPAVPDAPAGLVAAPGVSARRLAAALPDSLTVEPDVRHPQGQLAVGQDDAALRLRPARRQIRCRTYDRDARVLRTAVVVAEGGAQGSDAADLARLAAAHRYAQTEPIRLVAASTDHICAQVRHLDHLTVVSSPGLSVSLRLATAAHEVRIAGLSRRQLTGTGHARPLTFGPVLPRQAPHRAGPYCRLALAGHRDGRTARPPLSPDAQDRKTQP